MFLLANKPNRQKFENGWQQTVGVNYNLNWYNNNNNNTFIILTDIDMNIKTKVLALVVDTLWNLD